MLPVWVNEQVKNTFFLNESRLIFLLSLDDEILIRHVNINYMSVVCWNNAMELLLWICILIVLAQLKLLMNSETKADAGCRRPAVAQKILLTAVKTYHLSTANKASSADLQSC
jgi:hypothetical protein